MRGASSLPLSLCANKRSLKGIVPEGLLDRPRKGLAAVFRKALSLYTISARKRRILRGNGLLPKGPRRPLQPGFLEKARYPVSFRKKDLVDLPCLLAGLLKKEKDIRLPVHILLPTEYPSQIAISAFLGATQSPAL